MAELGLDRLQRHQLVGHEGGQALVEPFPAQVARRDALGEIGVGRGFLGHALRLQAVDEGLQLGIAQDAHAWGPDSCCMSAKTAPSGLAMKT